MAAMVLVREITMKCREIMDQTVTRVLSFVETLRSSAHSGKPDKQFKDTSPLVLHCIYRAAVAQAWMGSTASRERLDNYSMGYAACVEILRHAKRRWKVAGTYSSLPRRQWISSS